MQVQFEEGSGEDNTAWLREGGDDGVWAAQEGEFQEGLMEDEWKAGQVGAVMNDGRGASLDVDRSGAEVDHSPSQGAVLLSRMLL